MQDDSRMGCLGGICVVLFFVCYFGGVVGGALLGRLLIGEESGLMVGGAGVGILFGLAVIAFIGKVDPEMLLCVLLLTVLGLMLGRAIGQVEEAIEKYGTAQPNRPRARSYQLVTAAKK